MEEEHTHAPVNPALPTAGEEHTHAPVNSALPTAGEELTHTPVNPALPVKLYSWRKEHTLQPIYTYTIYMYITYG